MAKTADVVLSEGWYVPTQYITPPRWILAIGNGHIYYSRGGTTHFECSEKTMKRWIKRTAAQRKRRTPDSEAPPKENI